MITGFSELQTGGGCTALGRRFDHDGHVWDVLITQELNAPESLDQECIVSIELDEEYIAYAETHGEEEVRSAIAQLIAETMSNDVDYTISEVWPEWTDEVDPDVPVTVIRY